MYEITRSKFIHGPRKQLSANELPSHRQIWCLLGASSSLGLSAAKLLLVVITTFDHQYNCLVRLIYARECPFLYQGHFFTAKADVHLSHERNSDRKWTTKSCTYHSGQIGAMYIFHQRLIQPKPRATDLPPSTTAPQSRVF